MKRRFPRLTLIWMYQGEDAPSRLEYIRQLDYPGFVLIEVERGGAWGQAARAIPAITEVCVFWADDGKSVSRDFLQKMAAPLMAPRDTSAVLHFWSGNALSIPKRMVADLSIADSHASSDSLLKIVVPALDSVEKLEGRVHLAFSSTERLAPLSMEPVGFPS